MMSDERAPDNPDQPKAVIKKDHFRAEVHYGVEAIFDMGDYALTEAEKIALGIHRLEYPGIVEETRTEPAPE